MVHQRTVWGQLRPTGCRGRHVTSTGVDIEPTLKLVYQGGRWVTIELDGQDIRGSVVGVEVAAFLDTAMHPQVRLMFNPELVDLTVRDESAVTFTSATGAAELADAIDGVDIEDLETVALDGLGMGVSLAEALVAELADRVREGTLQ